LFTLWNILHGNIVDVTGPGNNSLLLATGWMVDVALSYVVLPRSKAVSRVVASMTTVEADNAEGGSSSQWRRHALHRQGWWQNPLCRLLGWTRSWAWNPLLVLSWTGSPVLVLMRRVGDVSRMHHPVLWCTTGWGSRSLPFLVFLVSTDGVVSYDGLAKKCGKSAISIERQTLLELSR
jgi:hypothetical protein